MLWEDRYWKLLLHYEDFESEIDSKSFFLAKNGKTSPKAELLKTIEELYKINPKNNDSAICKYPARTKWLKRKLSLKNLPDIKCTDYNKWIDMVDPKSASLIFSSAHINSPASMFGHTFLRIDSSFKSRLLSHAINYAAMADEQTENGLLYAIKGLVGGYIGKYSMLPYYDKLKEYRDTEQRDIWEYDLNLKEEEVRNMVDHIWELSNAFSYYYFFDENCSYNMLWLIEVARPSVNLRKYFTYHVSPPETIFAIQKENLIKQKHYRASKRSVILNYENNLKDSNIEITKKLSMGELNPNEILNNNDISKKDKTLILETAIELCEYNYIKRKLEKKQYLDIFHSLSIARSTLGKTKALDIPIPANPDLSHRQLKISFGNTHETKSNKNFLNIGIRPTYHDLTNNDTGFLKGTQIEFLNTMFRYNEDTNIELEFLKLLTINSIAPRTKLFTPFSWKTSWQYDRDGLDNELNFNANVSGGFSWSFLKENYLYILGDLSLYDNNYATSSTGITSGLVLYIKNSFKTNIEASYKYYNRDDEQKLFSLIQSYYPKSDMDLKLKYRYIEKFYKDHNNISFEFNYFF